SLPLTRRHRRRCRPRLPQLRRRRIRRLAATDPRATTVAAARDCLHFAVTHRRIRRRRRRRPRLPLLRRRHIRRRRHPRLPPLRLRRIRRLAATDPRCRLALNQSPSPSSHPSSSRIYVTVPSPHPHDDPRRRNGSWWPWRILGPDELPASQRSSLLLRSGLSDAALFSWLIPAPAPSSGRVRVRDSKSRWSDFSTPALASHRLRSARQQGKSLLGCLYLKI
ncbi:Os02g0478050, partial [Oryza sativa Japonica Group]